MAAAGLAGKWRPLLPGEAQRYEYWWAAAGGPRGGLLPAAQAAPFLASSGIGDRHILKTIWNLADATDRGSLTFDEFCVACRLVSAALRRSNPLCCATSSAAIPLLAQTIVLPCCPVAGRHGTGWRGDE